MTTVVCVDFGSTFTKAALVDLGSGLLLATASHATTLPGPDGDGDVLDGYDACLAALAEQDPAVHDADVLACSSAGGGLRIAVVGNEELVTAEAGRRVALSSGGKVVAVLPMSDGGLDGAALRAAEADIVLLTGGTDGGNAEAAVSAAEALADLRWDRPVVVACNTDAQPEVAATLARAGTPHVMADNVVPRIGVLAPGERPRGDPGDVPVARHRRQAPQQPRRRARSRVHRPGARRDARRGADRRRAAGPRPRRPAPRRR